MRRVTMMLVAMAVMVPLFAVVAYAATGGNAANAQKCVEGGYLDYTDANGDPFKNEGQCTRYAAKGGQLVTVPTGPPDISVDMVSGTTGTISGTGFTPNSPFLLEQTYSPSGDVAIVGGGSFSTNATGAFVIGPGWDFCVSDSSLGATGVQVTVTDSAEVSATEFVEVSCPDRPTFGT